MRVLIAEDDPASQRLLRTVLEKWGHEVTSAPNGAAAWEAFEQGDFPILITDWTMPGVDGLELIRRVRASGRYVYTILITARSLKEDLVEGMEAGADDFLVKPFDQDELRVRLRAGEQVVGLERTLALKNEALEQARASLERRVEERTADLRHANKKLRAEIVARQRALEELKAAQERILEQEAEKKRFQREVIRAVTQGKFHLVDPEEIPEEGERVLETPVSELCGYSPFLKDVQRIAAEAGMRAEVIDDFVLAVGEATSNALNHGVECRCAVYLEAERIIVRVSDRGPGIGPDDLPASVLSAGFSTKLSLGMGYTLMLNLADRVWLTTGPGGTVVQLDKWLCPEKHPPPSLLDLMDRF